MNALQFRWESFLNLETSFIVTNIYVTDDISATFENYANLFELETWLSGLQVQIKIVFGSYFAREVL